MENERYTTQRETSRQGSGPSTNQRLSYATDRAEVLFGCYRRGDANDPDRYVTAIAAVLTPPDVMSQLMMAGPLLLLYGVGIGVAWLFSTKPVPPKGEAGNP